MSSLKFQVIDADYIVLDKPRVRIFGKTDDNKPVCVYYDGFYPYFYSEYSDKIRDVAEAKARKVEVVEKFPAIGYHDKPKKFLKITMNDPKQVPEMRREIESYGIRTFESDILFVYRFMIDHGIKGMGWVEAEAVPQSSNLVTVPVFEAKSFKPVDIKKNTDLKILSFDIETVSENLDEGIDMERDPIIMISLSFSHEYRGKKRLVLVARPFSDDEALGFSDEKEMLEKFQQIIHEYDPDIITGYNIKNFDLPYVITRFKKNGLKAFLGRTLDKQATAVKRGQNWSIKIIGRIIADAYEIIKSDIYFPYKLNRFNLETVAQTVLGEGKTDVKYKEIYGLWNGSASDIRRLVEYAKQDADLVMKIIDRVSMFDKFIAISKLSGVLLEDSFGGQSKRIETMVLHYFRDSGFIMPSSPSDEESRQRMMEREKHGLKGAIVLDPVPGLYTETYIDVLDFKSLYPSIIMTFNICPTTVVIDEREDVDYHESPVGFRFVKESVRPGIIPRILDDILSLRFKLKAQLKEITDPDEYRYVNAYQIALKIMANSFYGYTGYIRARLYMIQVASSITAWGRWTIETTKRLIEENFGLKVVYGDTDSVFVDVGISTSDDIEKAREMGDKISEYITETLPGKLMLEFEKTYKSFLILAKKRYAGWKFEKKKGKWYDKIDMKGIETVRRDWCPLVTETMLEVINILLKENDVKKATGYVRETVRKLKRGEIPMEKLTIVKGLTKPPDKYDGSIPHVLVAKKMARRNPIDPPRVGDRIPFVIIKGNRLVSERAEDPEYVREKGLEIDYDYYINNQLLPPIERIFEVIGIQRSELLGEGRQGSLSDMFGKPKTKPNKGSEEIKLRGVEGFQCEKCKKTYRSMPLTGRCDCGGRVLIVSNGYIGTKTQL